MPRAYCDCDIVQRLEYGGISSSHHGSDSDGIQLPQYVFQLGRLILPAVGRFGEQNLPFVVVVDILDPGKAVWLIHSRDIAEDPKEQQEWYPSQYALDQFKCLFGNSRDPVYHVARVAPTLDEWLQLDYNTMISNVESTRRSDTVEIKPASVDELKYALNSEAQTVDTNGVTNSLEGTTRCQL
jgi:hypothetical protein